MARRVAAWESPESKLHEMDPKNKHDGKGNTYRKPGSQKK